MRNRLLKPNVWMVMLVLMLTMPSCEKYFGDVNVDPDNPIEVTPNVLLPQIEVRLAYTYWGDGSRYLSVYTGHVDGVRRQFSIIGKYGIQPVDVDQMWNNLYSGILSDLQQLKQIANESGYYHYSAVAKALEAYTLMFTTDQFGDIPYSTAFQGTDMIQPTYDAQESVYQEIFSLIAEARTELAMDNGGFAPRGDDLIYGGDVAAWNGFLNALEARGKLHLAEKDAANYQAALTALNNGGLVEDARISFGTATTENAPWYQYIEQRDDIEIGNSYRNIIDTVNDPRTDVYGVPLELPHPYFTPDRSVPLLSITETNFIQAEALFQTQGAAAAHDAWLAGIRSSFDDAGLTQAEADAYIATADPGAANLTLEDIIREKYIALFTDPEVFSDYRRTGLPNITPKVGNRVPSRLPYPEIEQLSNNNTPPPSQVNIYTHVWWDL